MSQYGTTVKLACPCASSGILLLLILHHHQPQLNTSDRLPRGHEMLLVQFQLQVFKVQKAGFKSFDCSKTLSGI